MVAGGETFDLKQGYIYNLNQCKWFGNSPVLLTNIVLYCLGLTDKVVSDRAVSFYFPSCGTIPPPVIMVQNVSFRYNDKTPWIYKNLEFGIDLDTRLGKF